MQTLRSVWDHNEILHPMAHEVQNMSLRELKQAAFAPTRLLAHFKRCSLSGEIPCSFKRTIFSEILQLNEPAGDGRSCRAAPGGRYLMTCTPTMLRLWDIGHGHESTIECRCTMTIGNVNSRAETCEIIDLRATPDNLGLRIILQVEYDLQ